MIFSVEDVLGAVDDWKLRMEEKWDALTGKEKDLYHIVSGLTLSEILNHWSAAAVRWQAKRSTES